MPTPIHISNHPNMGKDEYLCLACGKPVQKSGYSLACTVCGLWCHKDCAGISDEVFKFISAQVKATRVTYWGCRCCTSFAKSFHSKLGEMNKRLVDLENKTEKNADAGKANKEEIKKVREEVKELRDWGRS